LSLKERAPDARLCLKQCAPETTSIARRAVHHCAPLHVDVETYKAVRLVGVDEHKRLQRLMLEAVDLLLQSRGKPPIAVKNAPPEDAE
jgi:hypothetical protein